MTVEHISPGEPESLLRISGALDLSEAGALHQALSDYLANQSRATLDLSQVEACDVSALQLLCAAHKQALQSNQHFRLVAVSDVVQSTAAALGLSLAELTGDPHEL